MDASAGKCAASAPTCSVLDASTRTTSRSLIIALVWLVVVVQAVVSFQHFFPLRTWLLRGICRPLGLYLRKKTEGRREQLCEIVEEDERAWTETGGESSVVRGTDRSRGSDAKDAKDARAGSDGDEEGDEHQLSQPVEDGWESIDAGRIISSSNNGEPDDGWDGIIGFLHPFWYVLCALLWTLPVNESEARTRGLALAPSKLSVIRVVMPVVAASESSGLLSERRRHDGQRLRLSCTRATTT